MGGGGAGDGWGRPPEEVVVKELNRLLGQRDAAGQKLAQQVARQQREIDWLRAEIRGEHMTARDHYEAAAKYNGIVLTVGYAGFFGLWSMVKDMGVQCPKLHALAALCMGLSLFIFVLWEVFTMVVNTFSIAYPTRPGEEMSFFRKWLVGAGEALPKLWAWQFIPALFLGLAGIGSMSWVLIANVVAQWTGR